MAVSYPLSLPATPLFASARFSLSANTTVFTSPLSGVESVLERPGAKWAAEFTLPAMLRAQAAAWTAFFASLRGRRGTFYGYDPAATTPRGIATGTPLVKGASQTGNALATDGWTTSQTGILLAGDYIGVNSRLHMVVEAANSDGSGNATLAIEPALRESPADNAAITVSAPMVSMRLASAQVGWDVDTALFYGFSFAAIEAL